VHISALRNIALLVITSAPVALAAQGTVGAATPAAAVEEFMRAVSDSNLKRMGQLWGTAKGPASRTHMPKTYEKNIVIMQAMLHGVTAHALGDVPGEKPGIRTVTTQLSNHGCQVAIAINTVHATEGWLVQQFDLTQAAEVNKPCDTSKRPGTSGQ
jgi:hypothetical protein